MSLFFESPRCVLVVSSIVFFHEIYYCAFCMQPPVVSQFSMASIFGRVSNEKTRQVRLPGEGKQVLDLDNNYLL
jgi:hypothetical protein